VTDDLVKRLRWRAESNANCLCGNPVCDEAADRIEKLEAALRRIAQNHYGLQGMMEDGTDTLDAKVEYYARQTTRRQQIARKALEGKDE